MGTEKRRTLSLANDISLPPAVRENFLLVYGNYRDFHRIMNPLYFLYAHMPRHKLPHALAWLVRERLCGDLFMDYFTTQCGGSNLILLRRLTHAIEKNAYLRPVIARRDFTTN